MSPYVNESVNAMVRLSVAPSVIVPDPVNCEVAISFPVEVVRTLHKKAPLTTLVPLRPVNKNEEVVPAISPLAATAGPQASLA